MRKPQPGFWKSCEEQPTITVKKIADQMRLSVAGVRYHINKMKKDGLVEHVGPSKKGTWLLHDES